MMNARLAAVIFLSMAAACSREKPAPSGSVVAAAAASSTSVDVVPGDNFTFTARCAFHPNGKLEEIAATLPPGSVDAIQIDVTGAATTLVLVELTVDPNVPSGPRKFASVFRLESGVEIEKVWAGAPGNKSGTFRMIASVPAGAKHFGTVPRE